MTNTRDTGSLFPHVANNCHLQVSPRLLSRVSLFPGALPAPASEPLRQRLTPLLCAQDLLLGDPLHRAGLPGEDADVQLGRDLRAGAVPAAASRACAWVGGGCIWGRKVTVFLQSPDAIKMGNIRQEAR